jgi:uncharacterized DUF497 family protein
LFAGPVIVLPDHGHSQIGCRFRVIGRLNDERAVFVVFIIRERAAGRTIRPISARFMHREKIKRYEEENPGL